MASSKSLTLLDRFRGSMIGAVVGDCLGAPVECQYWDGISHDRVNALFKGEQHPVLWETILFHTSASADRVELSKNPLFKEYHANAAKPKDDPDRDVYCYTDDTAMARQVADSIISMRSVDSTDMAKRFVKEYFNHPTRGYGQAVIYVFKKLSEESCANPFGPAGQQFDGSGSYGNGAAMRVHPVGLWCYEKSDEAIFEEVTKTAKITHTNPDGVNGAILQAAAVSWALSGLPPDEIRKRAYALCQKFDKPDNEETLTYVKQMKAVDRAIDERTTDVKKLVDDIGNDVSAIHSVPPAIYSFLASVDHEAKGGDTNAFEKTLKLAMTFGGDSDTICTMAGAIAGAYYGESGIPSYMKEICEAVDNAGRQADQLHKLVTQ